MKKATNILITGFGEANMEILKGRLSQIPKVVVSMQILNENFQAFWGDPGCKPDVLVHFLGSNAENELRALIGLPPQDRPITLIVYDQNIANPSLMRLAMQAGARDFIMGVQLVDDTLASVRKILQEGLQNNVAQQSAITAVVNAKGGGGASTIACALGHAFAKEKGLQTLLLDLDLQFGMQCLILDLHPEQGLMDALASIESLDEIALMGYVAKHPSGLHVLGTNAAEVILPGDINPMRLNRFLEIIHHGYEQVVIDLPRLIDPVFNLVMEKADHVMVVLQQDLASLKGAQRLIQVMTNDLGVPVDRILPIINRYGRNNDIGLGDVERALALNSIAVVANDFKGVRTAANLGVPIADHAPKSPVTLSILRLADTLGGDKQSGKQRIFKQFLARLLSET